MIPVVSPSSVIKFAADAASERVIVSLARPVIRVAAYAINVAAVVPVIAVIPVAPIATEVLSDNVFRAAASTLESVTTTVIALLSSLSRREASVDMSPSLAVAVMTPVVSPSRVASCAVVAVPERVTASAVRPVTPELA